MLLIPVQADEYPLVLEFREKYAPYTQKSLIYEHVYNKKEMDNAEYYLLKCTTVIENEYEMKETLYDLNATFEVFTNVASRYYIISKKVYNILKELGTKGLKCEPVMFIET